MHAIDRPGVLADITRILGDAGISIEAILQKEPLAEASHVPIIFLTQRVKEKNIIHAITLIEKLDSINGEVMLIRMESLD